MENASKALIIAGAILIAILLISIGMILINSGSGVAESGTANMNSQKIQTFNAQFTPYEGTKKGSEIKGLWNAVHSSNGVYGEEHNVNITPETPATIKSMKNYEVTLTYDAGYVTEITVAEPSN